MQQGDRRHAEVRRGQWSFGCLTPMYTVNEHRKFMSQDNLHSAHRVALHVGNTTLTVPGDYPVS